MSSSDSVGVPKESKSLLIRGSPSEEGESLGEQQSATSTSEEMDGVPVRPFLTLERMSGVRSMRVLLSSRVEREGGEREGIGPFGLTLKTRRSRVELGVQGSGWELMAGHYPRGWRFFAVF